MAILQAAWLPCRAGAAGPLEENARKDLDGWAGKVNAWGDGELLKLKKALDMAGAMGMGVDPALKKQGLRMAKIMEGIDPKKVTFAGPAPALQPKNYQQAKWLFSTPMGRNWLAQQMGAAALAGRKMGSDPAAAGDIARIQTQISAVGAMNIPGFKEASAVILDIFNKGVEQGKAGAAKPAAPAPAPAPVPKGAVPAAPGKPAGVPAAAPAPAPAPAKPAPVPAPKGAAPAAPGKPAGVPAAAPAPAPAPAAAPAPAPAAAPAPAPAQPAPAAEAGRILKLGDVEKIAAELDKAAPEVAAQVLGELVRKGDRTATGVVIYMDEKAKVQEAMNLLIQKSPEGAKNVAKILGGTTSSAYFILEAMNSSFKPAPGDISPALKVLEAFALDPAMGESYFSIDRAGLFSNAYAGGFANLLTSKNPAEQSRGLKILEGLVSKEYVHSAAMALIEVSQKDPGLVEKITRNLYEKSPKGTAELVSLMGWQDDGGGGLLKRMHGNAATRSMAENIRDEIVRREEGRLSRPENPEFIKKRIEDSIKEWKNLFASPSP